MTEGPSWTGFLEELGRDPRRLAMYVMRVARLAYAIGETTASPPLLPADDPAWRDARSSSDEAQAVKLLIAYQPHDTQGRPVPWPRRRA
jgi:hypothetical protein